MKKIAALTMFLAFLLCASTASFAQSSKVNAWRTLGMMKYEKEFTSKGGASTTAVAGNGKFIGMIEKLEGEVITLKGYVIPLSGKKAQSHFMFSAFPYRSCFFCGKAGPESVVEVFTKDNQKIPFSEKSMTIKGRFEFTSRNTDGVMFSLKEAELVDR